MSSITDVSRLILVTALSKYSPGKRLIFYEIVDLNKMTMRPIVQMHSDKQSGEIWYDNNDNAQFDWTAKYPETFIGAIKMDILLPGTLDMFSSGDQDKLVDQEIRSLLVKSVFITRAHLGSDDFLGVLVVESDEDLRWKQNDLIEIIKVSEKISLGIICNDLLKIIHDEEINSIPATITQTSSYNIFTDGNGTILYAPYSIEDIFGYRAYGEMLARNIAKFVHPDDVAFLKKHMSGKSSGGMKIITENIRYVTRTKGVCMCSTRVISDGSGNVILKIDPPIWNDAEKSVIGNSILYNPKFIEYFTEQIEGIVWMVNDKLEFTYISSYATKLLGWSVEQLIHDARVSMFDIYTLELFADALVRGALSYRENPQKMWTEEITGKLKTWDEKLIDVNIGIALNIRGGDYQGFGGVIRPIDA